MADERVRLLREAVEYLAMDAEGQVKLLEASRFPVDELGLMFDDIYLAVPDMRSSGIALSDSAVDALEEVDRKLDAMSGHHNAGVWTESSLRTDRRWAEIREAAKAALSELPTP